MMVFYNARKAFPPGRQPLPQDFVDRHKRERIALAIARLVCEVGIRGLTVDSITSEAKTARATFYELFPNREEALEYAIELGNRRLIEAIDDTAEAPGEWQARVEVAIGRLLEAAASEPELSELCLVHGRGCGSYPGPVHPDLVQALAAILCPGRKPGPEPAPTPLTEELIAFGIVSVISERLWRGELDTLRSLGPELSELATHPFLGREAVPTSSAHA